MKWPLVLAAALLPSIAAAQAMYKCVDSRGVTHYTDKPLPGCKGREVEPGKQSPTSGKLAPPRENPQRGGRDVQRRKTAAEEAREAELRALEQQKRRCGLLKGELRRQERGQRLRSADKAAQSTLDDAARASRAGWLKEEIGRACR